MDISGQRKGEAAPTPNNTPRANAPIQQQQQQGGGKKGKGGGNNQQQQPQQPQQPQKQQQPQQQNQPKQTQPQQQKQQQPQQQNQPKQAAQPQQQQQQKGKAQSAAPQAQPEPKNQKQQGGKKPKQPEPEPEDEEEDEEEDEGAGEISLNNPQLAQMLGAKLSAMMEGDSAFLSTLPADVQRRVKALKNIQDKHAILEAKFREEILALEAKYLGLQQPLYNKRKEIVNGKVEPTDEECERDDSENEEEEEGEGNKPKAIEGGKTVGIPHFWFRVLSNHPLIADTIMEHDEPVLEHLTDITLSYANDNLSFTLEFHFSSNPFFTNKSQTKTYFMENPVGPAYEDVMYSRAEGCKIDWNTDKDVTVRVETKKQKNKTNKKVRVVKTLVPQDSFFRFFSPPAAPTEEDEEEPDPELEEQIERDFEAGDIIKAKLIPNAIDWFTGKALQYDADLNDDDYEDEGDYDEMDDDEYGQEDDDDEEDDDDDDSGAPPAQLAKPGEKPAECNQQ